MQLTYFLLTGFFALGASAQSWPYGPFTTDGRWIHNTLGQNVTYAGVNWPGAADTMLPEGLQYASIADTMTKIKSLGMNVIRLTFAIEMIDQIYENGKDVAIGDALTDALGATNGSKVLQQILNNNPSFTSNTTRLEVFDAVAAEAAKQQIYIHLDNHVSKAQWCCSTTDGNAWFGDDYFNVDNWKRGWEYMAKHASSWSNFMSVGLRNELREPADNSTAEATYDWAHWYTNMVAGAKQVNSANPNPLIFFSGLNYDTTLSPVVTGADLGNGQTFDLDAFDFKNKIVFELHNYATGSTSCDSLKSSLYSDGFDALNVTNTSLNHAPVVMTEFGFQQDDSTYEGVYASCLREYLPEQHAGWMVWVIAGSYYIRSGTQDSDDTWGLLTHNWSAWRSPDAIDNGLKPLVQATLGL